MKKMKKDMADHQKELEVKEVKIEKLTGSQITEIEKELFDFRKETVPGLSIEALQKLASLLILFSNGVLPDDTTEDEYRGDRWHIATKLLEKEARNLNGCVAGLTPLHTAVRCRFVLFDVRDISTQQLGAGLSSLGSS